MTLAVIAGLAGLALVDSTSIGTLLFPIWMLTHPSVRAGRVGLYLATIGGFYWVLGLALMAGASALTDHWAAIGESDVTNWVQLGIGVAMLIGSFWPDTPWGKRRAATSDSGGRRAQMRERVVGERSTASAVISVALLSGPIEAASMLPYIGAIGLISTSDLALPAQAGLLLGYVVVMCLPALILLGLRVGFADRVAPTLERIEAWLTRHTGGAIWWVVGILGFFLAADAATRLGLFGATGG